LTEHDTGTPDPKVLQEFKKEMIMARILILYASQEGQTAKVADFLAEALKEEGHEVEVAPAKSPPKLSGYDAVMIGASIHVGQYPKEVQDYIKAHKGELARLVSAFFSVSLTAAQTDETSQETVKSYLQGLQDDTGWKPDEIGSFAGALKFTRYGFFKRQLMKAITKKGSLDADASRDHEYTDWEAVAAFAQAFARQLERAPVAT
jgi:menaquinone-dependent protoporphyrinogen oxidase